jgi:hypothetical protein
MRQLDCAYIEDLFDCIEKNLSTPILERATAACRLALASYFDCLTSLGCDRILSCEHEEVWEVVDAECDLPGSRE